MKKAMIAKAPMTYATRRLKAGDPFEAPRRDARLLQALGKADYATRDMAAEAAEPADELAALRAQYQDVIGKRPFHGWDAATLREKIAEAGEA